MSKLDVEQNKQRDALFRRHLPRLMQMDRQYIQDARRKLLAIPKDVWDQAVANDAAAEEGSGSDEFL